MHSTVHKPICSVAHPQNRANAAMMDRSMTTPEVCQVACPWCYIRNMTMTASDLGNIMTSWLFWSLMWTTCTRGRVQGYVVCCCMRRCHRRRAGCSVPPVLTLRPPAALWCSHVHVVITSFKTIVHGIDGMNTSTSGSIRRCQGPTPAVAKAPPSGACTMTAAVAAVAPKPGTSPFNNPHLFSWCSYLLCADPLIC